jgi:prepilin-type N-terminal cleavage/methylation domain-containing protein
MLRRRILPTDPSRPRGARGLTLIEVTISMAVMTIAMAMFSGVITTTTRIGSEKRLASVASHAARSQLERLRCQPFAQVWRLYNESSADDPAGAGTGPGPHFEVPGLKPLKGDADGFVGRVVLPHVGTALLENAVDEGFGLPRDLNGDTLIDERDHAGDYAILPVMVELEWDTPLGPRRLEMHTMLAGYGS